MFYFALHEWILIVEDVKKIVCLQNLIKLLAICPFFIFLVTMFFNRTGIGSLFLFISFAAMVLVHFYTGYSWAKWTIGVFSILYSGFQIYVFSRSELSTTFTVIVIAFFILLCNAIFMLVSPKFSTSFKAINDTLPASVHKYRKISFVLFLIAVIALLLIDVARLFG
jgi:hypothetical protein